MRGYGAKDPDIVSSCSIWLSNLLGPNILLSDANLYNVNLPNTLKTIYDNAFAECALLYEVLLPESLEKIKFAAFNNCRNLSSIVLPNNLTHIEEIAFGNCNKLNTIIIPESVIYIKSGAFAECFDVKFYCKVNEQPSKWADDWNDSNSPIIWGYKG